jgi:acyl-CoA synthetase (AMP-forming)/AMP-acid ligase II
VTQPTASPTLDTLFKRILARQPDALALVDPFNKQRVTGQPPKRLTFAQADRMISSLAAHFIESGLPSNSVIAVQLPNTIEFALTVLAAFRAGLVVAVLPLLWRQSELTIGAQPHRGAGDRDVQQGRWRHLFGSRHERRSRGVLDPPRLRLRR